MLHKQGCSHLKNKFRFKKLKEDIKQGGTNIDKWKHIEMETFNRFKEARECLVQVRLYKIFVEIDFKNSSFNNMLPYIGFQVTTRTLQQWAMVIAFPFLSDNFNFCASIAWVNRF